MAYDVGEGFFVSCANMVVLMLNCTLVYRELLLDYYYCIEHNRIFAAVCFLCGLLFIVRIFYSVV